MKEITGFTPEPWERKGRLVYALMQHPCGNYMVNRFSAVVQNDTYLATEEEIEANSRLIQAAPELYAECQTLRAQRDMLVKALEWYADPEHYYGIALGLAGNTAGFRDKERDFGPVSDVFNPNGFWNGVHPGRRARAALDTANKIEDTK